MFNRLLAISLSLAVVAGCGRRDLEDPPVDLGNFRLGLNIAVADKAEKVPISRAATPDQWEAAMSKAVKDRFGRYSGTRLYNIGVSVDGYALAPPGIPIVAAPRSVLVVTANVWDDAAQKKLNAEGKQITVWEDGAAGIFGTGYTRSAEDQMEVLSYYAAKKIEEWMIENPTWFGITSAAPAGPVAQASPPRRPLAE